MIKVCIYFEVECLCVRILKIQCKFLSTPKRGELDLALVCLQSQNISLHREDVSSNKQVLPQKKLTKKVLDMYNKVSR